METDLTRDRLAGCASHEIEDRDSGDPDQVISMFRFHARGTRIEALVENIIPRPGFLQLFGSQLSIRVEGGLTGPHSGGMWWPGVRCVEPKKSRISFDGGLNYLWGVVYPKSSS